MAASRPKNASFTLRGLATAMASDIIPPPVDIAASLAESNCALQPAMPKLLRGTPRGESVRRGANLFLVALLACSMMAAAPPAGSSADWRDVDPNNLVLIDTRHGEIAVELAPDFAPRHVARVRALIRAHFYDGQSFYRVIDGFVAQGGMGEGTASTKAQTTGAVAKAWPRLKAEFDAPVSHGFTPLGSPDLFAPEVGHVNGFPVARDHDRMWIIHCPGTFAFARDNDNDTATTEFYIVIGQGPRRLDRMLTAFGRVIDGMQFVQKLNRGNPEIDNGVIQDPKLRDPIIRVRLAADLPAKDRPHFQVMRTDSAALPRRRPPNSIPHRSFTITSRPGCCEYAPCRPRCAKSLEARPRGGRRLRVPGIAAMSPVPFSDHAPCAISASCPTTPISISSAGAITPSRSDGLLLLIAIVSIAVQGFNLGIDFTGGVLLEAKAAHAIDVGGMRRPVDGLGLRQVRDADIGGGECDKPVGSCVLIQRAAESTAAGRGGHRRDQGQTRERLYLPPREVVGPSVSGELFDAASKRRCSRSC